MRALKSPAINERASVVSVRRKASLKPRTPTSAATPTATERTTNANFPGADFRSRQPIAAALFQLSARLAIVSLARDEDLRRIRNKRQRVFDDHAIFQDDFAIGATGHLGIVCHQHKRG